VLSQEIKAVPNKSFEIPFLWTWAGKAL